MQKDSVDVNDDHQLLSFYGYSLHCFYYHLPFLSIIYHQTKTITEFYNYELADDFHPEAMQL